MANRNLSVSLTVQAAGLLGGMLMVRSGFFVQCMADVSVHTFVKLTEKMLGSEAFEINADNAFHISGPSTEYATGLRDMLAVYSVSEDDIEG